MAEKSVSYMEASKSVPTISRSYADITKSQPQSYRKTVTLKPKSHAPLSPSYDRVAHQLLTSTPKPSQPDGCALNNDHSVSPDWSPIIQILLNVLSSLMSSSNMSLSKLPSNVAYSLSTVLSHFNNGSGGLPSMECEERVS